MTEAIMLFFIWLLSTCIGYVIGRTLYSMKISDQLDRMADERRQHR